MGEITPKLLEEKSTELCTKHLHHKTLSEGVIPKVLSQSIFELHDRMNELQVNHMYITVRQVTSTAMLQISVSKIKFHWLCRNLNRMYKWIEKDSATTKPPDFI